MADDISREHEDDQKARQVEHEAAQPESELQGETLTSYPGTLLGDTRLGGRGNSSVRAAVIQNMQQTRGNRATQRMLQRAAGAAQAPASTEEDIGQKIEQRAGRGTSLDTGARGHIEKGLGANLSGVRVHTDGEADSLARSVDAVAFTSGQDIFFRQGAYNPGTQEGMKLIAHEATHTVQQSQGPVAGTPSVGGVSVSDPSDSFEQAAERSAEQVVSGGSARGQLSPTGGDAAPVQREAEAEPVPEEEELKKPEEEEPVQTMRTSTYSTIQRESIPEEEAEPLQTMRASAYPSVQREGLPEEEEEPLQTMRTSTHTSQVQREAMPEEEEEEEETVQTMPVQRQPDPNRAGPGLTNLQSRGPVAIQRSFTGSHAVTHGSFEMSMMTSVGTMVKGKKHYGMFGDIKFKPHDKAPYSNKIGLVQILKATDATPKTGGGFVDLPGSLPKATSPKVRTTEDKAKGVEGGFHTDVYHKDITKKGTANSPYYAFTPTFGFVRRDDKGVDIKEAGLWDSPGSGPDPSNVDFSFETVAKGDDNMTTYGSVKWSFGVRSDKGGQVINESMTVQDAASATFEAAMEKHRDFYVHEPVTFYFGFDRDVPDPGEIDKIDKFLAYLSRFPDVKLTLAGYADQRGGSGDYNENLASRRSEAIKRALLAKGVAAARLNPLMVEEGGSTAKFTADAISDQDLERNRRGNRRVTLTFEYVPASGGGGGTP